MGGGSYMIRFNVRSTFSRAAMNRRVEEATRLAQMQLDNDVIKDSNFFIPKDTGNLEASSILHSQVGDGLVVWQAPYARKQYYGTTYDFSKDVNPNAQALWFEAAKARNKPNWLEKVREQYRQYFGGV